MGSRAEAASNPSTQQTRNKEDELIVAIVEAVAAAKDADPLTLDVPLDEQIDLDALTTLYTSSQQSDTSLTVEFTIDGCTVTIRSDGEITVAD